MALLPGISLDWGRPRLVCGLPHIQRKLAMAKFIVRRLLTMLLTMLIVSIIVFAVTELAPGNVVRNILGAFATPEQEESFRAQLGLDQPPYIRYLNWLIGSDWRAERQVGIPLRRIKKAGTEFYEWWAVEPGGPPIRWKLEGEDLIALRLQPEGTVEESIDNERWQISDPAAEAARLRTCREELLQNTALTEAERETILEQLDCIVAILDREDQSQKALAAALAKPEAVLDALIKVDISKVRGAFAKAADELANDELYQAIMMFDGLSDPAIVGEQESVLKSMARRLGKAADTLEEASPTLAATVREAGEKLDAGDITGSRETLERAVPALQGLLGPFVAFIDALKAKDYQQATSAIRDLADPAKTPLDATRLAIMPKRLRNAGQQLEDVDADVGTALQEASESLEEGNTAIARESISQAADRLDEVVRTMTVAEAAKKVGVIRSFWGVDTHNHAVLWEKGTGQTYWMRSKAAGWWVEKSGGPKEYIPLQKGMLRGDPGESVMSGRAVLDTLLRRLQNSIILAAIAFVIVMPLALVLGLLAGLNEGKPLDRILSVGGLATTATPNFATGIFLILIFAIWLKLLPGATVFVSERAIFENPKMLILPVLTLTLIELGYVLRITRASMVEVMNAPYIRTAFLKGLPYWRIVSKHALRNALMAPITVIMLHVNWLMGGIVVVEAIFGFPGLGRFLLDAALYKDVFAIEAGAMVMVMLAVGTQLVADIIYTFLNPRIRYA